METTESRLARVIEGEREPQAIDAPHWIRVYTELIAEIRTLAAEHPDQRPGLTRALGEFESRLDFWRHLLHRP